MILSIIAAVDLNHVIGNKGQMPWHLPAELQYFKKVTMGKPIIMGRKTHESIAKALPGRRNVVISRNPDFQAFSCDVVTSIETALELVSQNEEVMIIGGEQIYKQALPHATYLYLTVIQHEFEGDTFFPDWRTYGTWQEVKREQKQVSEDNPYVLDFLVLKRTSKIAVI